MAPGSVFHGEAGRVCGRVSQAMRSNVLTRVVMENRETGWGNLSHGARRGNGLIPDCSGTQRNLGEWSSVVLTLLETSAENITEFILVLLGAQLQQRKSRGDLITFSYILKPDV